MSGALEVPKIAGGLIANYSRTCSCGILQLDKTRKAVKTKFGQQLQCGCAQCGGSIVRIELTIQLKSGEDGVGVCDGVDSDV
jgi:hypothetical protein